MEQAHDREGADALLPNLLERIQAFLGDKRTMRRSAGSICSKKAGVQGVIPPKNNRKEQRVYDVQSQTSDRELLRQTQAVQGDSNPLR